MTEPDTEKLSRWLHETAQETAIGRLTVLDGTIMAHWRMRQDDPGWWMTGVIDAEIETRLGVRD